MTQVVPLKELKSRLVQGKVSLAEIDQYAVLWLHYTPNRAAAEFFDAVNKHPREDVISSAVYLAKEFADRDAQWRQLLSKSISRKGRCPSYMRKALAAALSSADRGTSGTGQVDPTAGLFITKDTKATQVELAAKLTRSSSLRITTDLTGIRGSPQLIGELNALEPDFYGVVELDFSGCEHFYVSGLAIIALFLRQKKWKWRAKGLHGDSEKYLDRIGFRSFITSGVGGELRDSDHGWSMALQPIAPGSMPEDLSERLVAIVDKHGFIDPVSLSALKIAFAEILENVLRHSNAALAIAGAQYYPSKNKLHFTVVDSGMGILESFASGRNELLRRTVQTERLALEMALRPLVTSKPVIEGISLGHAGFGLFIVSELARRNHGTFVITSGGTTVTRYSRFDRPEQTVLKHSPWPGTIVTVLFDLASRLPIQEVYRSLPPAAGFEAVDYFSDG